MSFDIDQSVSRYPVADAIAGEHVFVSGLARSGTTILMRQLYESRRFASLTYRHMPFVLAPTLWGKINKGRGSREEPLARAHGDRILVNSQSPECLDEVFWRVFDGDQYIKEDRLVPHSPDSDLVGRFQRYVSGILHAAVPHQSRYLAKNNNNILRLATIARTFPSALFLIPFRHPVYHANSLMEQDRRFIALQDTDPFILTYMNWLAHHEFGRGHRQFVFSEDMVNPYPRHEINYWLFLWCQTYDWLLNTAPDRSIFVCYEELCGDPAIWQSLARRCGVVYETSAEHPFKVVGTRSDTRAEPDLLGNAIALYEVLRGRSRESFSEA